MTSASRTLRTADGTHLGAFGTIEWALLLGTAAIWGSSFLWIAIGLDSLHPAVIALARTALGATVLQFAPRARVPIGREAWLALAIVAVVGNALPALLFGFAEQRISSSVAGMIQAATPLMVLGIAIVAQRKSPGPLQVIGLFVGFCGAVVLASPSLRGAEAERLGVLLVLLAVLGYAISSTLIVPLAQDYGGAAVVGWALIISAVLLTPYGLWGLSQSTFEWPSVIAVVILGVFGTGLARMSFATLLGRAGATRASLVSYLVPVVAVVLGVSFRDDQIGVTEIAGLTIVLLAARMVSRAQRG